MEINIIKELDGRVYSEVISNNGKKTKLTPIFVNKKQSENNIKVQKKHVEQPKTLELKRINIEI